MHWFCVTLRGKIIFRKTMRERGGGLGALADVVGHPALEQGCGALFRHELLEAVHSKHLLGGQCRPQGMCVAGVGGEGCTSRASGKGLQKCTEKMHKNAHFWKKKCTKTKKTFNKNYEGGQKNATKIGEITKMHKKCAKRCKNATKIEQTRSSLLGTVLLPLAGGSSSRRGERGWLGPPPHHTP